MVSTHIYSISKDIGGKMLILQLNLGMLPLKSIISAKEALFWGFQHTFIVVSQGDTCEKTFISSE